MIGHMAAMHFAAWTAEPLIVFTNKLSTLSANALPVCRNWVAALLASVRRMVGSFLYA